MFREKNNKGILMFVYNVKYIKKTITTLRWVISVTR